MKPIDWGDLLHRQVMHLSRQYDFHPLGPHAPIIRMDWDGLWHPRKPSPTILWEDGPHDWAISWSLGPHGYDDHANWYSEPENGFILSYFPIRL